jgi:hypothetical protein
VPAVTLICESCKKPFQGRPNRRTCSVNCRRSLEMGRRVWDRRAGHVRFLELNANSKWITQKQRENWQRQFEETSAKLGPRPWR